MKKNINDKQTAQEIPAEKEEHIFMVVDKRALVEKLATMAKEAIAIASYIDENISYGRALGYAEGKAYAYADLIDSILDGDLDPVFSRRDKHEYEM